MNINISIQDVPWQRYALYVLAFLFLIFTGVFSCKGGVSSFLFLSLIILFLTIIIKPLVGLIVSIPLFLYFSYIDVFWVSPWNYVLFFLVFIALITLLHRGKIKLNRLSQRILLIFILYVFLATAIDWIQSISPSSFLYDGMVLVSTLLLGFCTMFFIKNKKQLKIFLYFLACFMSISAFVGIMQFVGVDFFWELREFWGVNPKIAPDILARTRISGLALYSIPLGYQLASTVPLIYGVLLTKRDKIKKSILFTSFIICLLALLMTKGRSAIIGGIFGLGVITFYGLRFEKRRLIALVIALIMVISILVAFSGKFSLGRFTFGDVSTPARISAFVVSGKVFLEHPFGSGRNLNKYYAQHQKEFEELTCKYTNQLTPYRLTELPRWFEERSILAPHNHFINILLFYGIFGFVLLVLFYYYIFKGLACLFRKNKENPLIKAITLGLIGSFTAYIINSLFHNGGPFLADPFHWYFIGITLFLLNRYGRTQEAISKL